MKSFLLLISLSLLSEAKLSDGACSPSLFKLESNSLLTLSDDLLNATEAEKQCNSLGGNLVVVKDRTINKTMITSLIKYTEDLKRIRKYFNAATATFSYATDLKEDGWVVPIEKPNYIYLYNSSTNFGNQLILFCKPSFGSEIRNIARNSSCPGNKGWIMSGLSGKEATSTSSKYKTVYSVEAAYGGVGKPLSANLTYDLPDRGVIPKYEAYYEFNEPVFYVYIGAQFDNSSNKWTWNDGSEAHFDTSGLTDCQQKALHYEEDWVFTNKDCTDEAYYACQVKNLLEPYWKQSSCNGSVIEVGWKHNLDGIEKNIINVTNVTVKVEGQAQNQIVSLNSSAVTIDHLIPDTSYNILVKAKFGGCTNFTIESTLSITTGDSPLDPVTDAFVWSPYECIVEIPPQTGSPSSGKPTEYQIIAKSDVNTTKELLDLSSSETSQATKWNISMRNHGFEKIVNLTITSLSGNCSALTYSVKGHCISPAVCNISTTEIEDSVLTLSDEPADVITAQEKCFMLGGNLVTITDPNFNETLSKIMTMKYAKDLTRVWIFYDESNSRLTKYSKNPNPLFQWKSTETLGELAFVDLSNKIFPNVSKKSYFCRYNQEKWSVQSDNCDDGWTTDFMLYGESNSSWIFKEIYNYRDGNNINPTFSTRLLSEDEAFGNYTEKQGNVYVADVNVFIGARYDVDSEKWLWSDGSEASFEQPSSKTCQQKILHYGKSWELADVDCDHYQALFACQTILNISMSSDICNSTFAQAKWANNLSKFLKQTGHEIRMKIELTESGINEPSEQHQCTYDELGSYFSNLTSRTTYFVKVTAIFEGCNNFNISSTMNFTTGYGRPDPVSNPQVQLSGDSCIVTVDQDDPSANVEQFVITAKSAVTSTVQTFNGSDVLNLIVPTRGHGTGNEILLTIFSTNCEGESESVEVEGVCSSPSGVSLNLEDGSPVGAIVGGIIAGLVVLVTVAVIFMYRRRIAEKIDASNFFTKRQELRPNFSSPDARTSDQPQLLDDPHAVQEMISYVHQDPTYQNISVLTTSSTLLAAYRTKCSNGGKAFKEELETIEKTSKANYKPHATALHPSNAQRNRYKNIYPYDHSRVVLSNNGESDYINAAFIPGFTEEYKFIATQGPKDSTIDDFWLMTWQQGSNVIIMLTKLREIQKVKCEKYWPELGKSKFYGSIKVQTTEESTLGGIVQRKFRLYQNMETLIVTQFHYVTWPDHGIPAATSNMFYLRKMVEETHDKAHPIIVHCSAGAGRTGTYIAMDFLFDQLDAEGKCDVFRCVSNMRENRTNMVQNWKQYALVYKLIVEYQVFPESERTADELQALTEADASKIMIQEFNLLCTSVPTSGADKDAMIIRIWDDDSQSLMEMNASRIQGLVEGTSYISAQGPVLQTEKHFWTMAFERHNGLIICMEGNSDHVANAVEHETIQMGKISIRVESSHNHGFAIEKELSYSGAVTVKRKLVSLTNWTSTATPSVTAMLDFLKMVQQLRCEYVGENVLVYCNDGCSKSGTLIALMNVLERVRTQNKVDVFRTVKDLRDARPNMVDNLNDYRFIYAIVMEYLNSFNPYVNLG